MVMAQSMLIQVRVDKELKEDMDKLLNDLGLDIPTAVRMFLKQVQRRRGLPFAVSQFNPNAETIAAMEEAEKIANDPNRKRYSSFSEILDEVKGEMLNEV